MTDQEQPKKTDDKKEPELTPEEIRERKIKERIEELRRRDPFIYR